MQVKNRYPNLKAPAIFADLGFDLRTSTTILDFGCGSGANVQKFRRDGIPAYGCDLKFKSRNSVDTTELERCGYLRKIDLNPYKLRFDDNFFDLVFSDQVFEHVQNYDQTLAEIARVLKPGGCSVHIFPSRYRFIEAHVNVPLASVVRAKWWLWLWAAMGIRNKYQSGQSACDVADRNHAYLQGSTNYLSKRSIQAHFESWFDDVSWREDLYLRHAKRSSAGSEWIPFMPTLVRTLKCRVVVAQKPHAA